VQTRLKAAHHLDVPYTPADLWQRDGRIIRPGNRWDEIRVIRYITVGSFDSTMWDILGRKAAWLRDFYEGNLEKLGTISDMDSTALSFKQIMSAASGDPQMMELVKLEARQQELEIEQAIFAGKRSRAGTDAALGGEAEDAQKRSDEESEHADRLDRAWEEGGGEIKLVMADGTEITEGKEIGRVINMKASAFSPSRQGVPDQAKAIKDEPMGEILPGISITPYRTTGPMGEQIYAAVIQETATGKVLATPALNITNANGTMARVSNSMKSDSIRKRAEVLQARADTLTERRIEGERFLAEERFEQEQELVDTRARLTMLRTMMQAAAPGSNGSGPSGSRAKAKLERWRADKVRKGIEKKGGRAVSALNDFTTIQEQMKKVEYDYESDRIQTEGRAQPPGVLEAPVIPGTIASMHENQPGLLDRLENQARARIKGRHKSVRLGSILGGVDGETVADWAIIGAVRIIKGAKTFAEWSAQMVGEFGDTIKPHLETMWGVSQEEAEKREPGSTVPTPLPAPKAGIVSRFTGIDALQKHNQQVKQDKQNLDKWIAQHDKAELRARIRARKHIMTLRQIAGRRGPLESFWNAAQGEGNSRVRDLDMAIQLYIDLQGKHESQYKKWKRKLSKKQQRLYEMSQSLPAEAVQLAEQIMEENLNTGIEGVEKGVLFRGMENKEKAIKELNRAHTARMWDFGKTPEGQRPLYAKFHTTTSRALPRTLDSILHGWARGYELRIQGAVSAQLAATIQVQSTIADRDFIKRGLKQGILNTNNVGTKVDHPGFTKWVWIGRIGDMDSATIYRTQGVHVSKSGDVFQEKPIYAERSLALRLNRILKQAEMDAGGTIFSWIAQKTLKYGHIMKANLLFTNLFHPFAFLRSSVLGGPSMRPIKSYRDGRDSIKAMKPLLEELTGYGLTLGLQQDFEREQSNEKTIFGRVLDKIPVAKQAKNLFLAGREVATDITFNHWGANLKASAAMLEFTHRLKHHRKRLEAGTITREEIGRAVAKAYNKDFGGLHAKRQATSKTRSKWLHLLMLAPDWTISNLKSFLVAFRRGEEGAILRLMWGRVIGKGLTITILLNLLMAAMGDDDDDEDLGIMRRALKNYQTAWDEGNFKWLDVDVTPLYQAYTKLKGEDPDGTRKYISIFGHFLDPLKWVASAKYKTNHPAPWHSFQQAAKHKASVPARVVLDFITASNWRGERYTTLSEFMGTDDKGLYKTTRKGHYTKGQPKGGKLKGKLTKWEYGGGGGTVSMEQMPSFVAEHALGNVPIAGQAALAYITGQIDEWDAMLKGGGIKGSSTKPRKEVEKKTPTRYY